MSWEDSGTTQATIRDLREKLSKLRGALEATHNICTEKITGYEGGDRPPSPPVWLLKLDDLVLSVLEETKE